MLKKYLFLMLGLTAITACQTQVESQSTEDYANAMTIEHQHDQPTPTRATQPAASGVNTTGAMVEYGRGDGAALQGYFARPMDKRMGYPGVIMIHEWWGLNDNIRAMADKLAGQGYVVLAVDLYGGGVADTPEQARALMRSAMSDDVQVNQNLTQAQTWLAQSQKAPRIGSIGWCFGGGMSLRTALLLPEAVDASIIYYGFVDPDSDQLPSLNVPLLGLFGAEDDGIPVATVEAFADRLEALDKDAEIIIYDDADHAFANPSGNRYNAEAAEAAWQETLSFFAAHLQENE